jgi:CRP-like cAMP-binding protein
MVDGHIKSDVLVQEADLIVEFLQKVECFRGLTVGTLASVADKMWSEEHPAGETIIRQGEPGKTFYVVRKGEVEVLREKEGRSEVVVRLGEGSSFGEEALLTGNPRNATVRTTKPTLLYVLGDEDFHHTVATSDTVREELHKVLFERQ